MSPQFEDATDHSSEEVEEEGHDISPRSDNGNETSADEEHCVNPMESCDSIGGFGWKRLKRPYTCCVPTLYGERMHLPAAEQVQHTWNWRNRTISLYSDGKGKIHSEEKVHFDAACGFVLLVLGNSAKNEEWDGKWRCDKEAKQRLKEDIERTATEAGVGRADEILNKDELISYVEQNRAQIEDLPLAVQGLLNPDLVEAAFKDFDFDRNGMDLKEWIFFLDELEKVYLEWMLDRCHMQFRAFWGRGQNWFEKYSVNDICDFSGDAKRESKWMLRAAGKSLQLCDEDLVSDEEEGLICCASIDLEIVDPDILETSDSLFVIKRTPWGILQVSLDPDCLEGSWLPPGWRQDLYYYIANNHPLFGIFACDPNHDLNFLERIFMEAVTIAFIWEVNCWEYHWVYDGEGPAFFYKNPFGFILLVSTLPSMVLWWILYLSFVGRFTRIDKVKATKEQIQRWSILEGVGSCFGFSISIAVFAAVAYDYYGLHHHGHLALRVKETLLSRLYGYIIPLIVTVGVYFNPFAAFGQPDPFAKQGVYYYVAMIGDLIGLGQWRIEKQLFQTKIIDALRLQLDRAGMLSPSARNSSARQL